MLDDRVHIIIKGRVQGVFFRAHTQKKAQKLGLKGWVRNLADGAVEAVFEGEKASIEKILAWAKKGPRAAKVEDVVVEWQQPQGELDYFEIRY